MDNKREIELLKNLIKGNNPITKEPLKDEIFNNSEVIRTLFYTLENIENIKKIEKNEYRNGEKELTFQEVYDINKMYKEGKTITSISNLFGREREEIVSKLNLSGE